jgi:hypothetical protein
VPHVDGKHEGKPNILALRDLTGDGLADEFVLFMYGACGIVDTSVLGYSRLSDLAMQYPVEIVPEQKLWVEQVFAIKPRRSGYWDFAWRPAHGSDDYIHEEVSFDSARQMFVDKQTVTQRK